MNCPKICPINLLCESRLLHRLSAILSLWPCWEWWLDLSQPAIDGLALNWDDWVALLCMHMYIAFCVPWCVLRVLMVCAMLPSAKQQHICFAPSPFALSFEFRVLSIIASTALHCLWLTGTEQDGFPLNKVSWFRHQIIIKMQQNVVPVEI